MQEIPAKKSYEFKLYQTSIVYGGKIYFLPFNASNVAIYDLNTRIFEIVEIPQLQRECQNGRFMNGFVTGDTLVMIPFGARRILHFDMKCCQVTGECSLDGIIKEEDLFYCYTKTDDDKLLLPSLTSNTVVFYDIKSKYATITNIGKEDFCYAGIALSDNN